MPAQAWYEWTCDWNDCDGRQNITLPHPDAPPGWATVYVADPDSRRLGANRWLFCPIHALEVRRFLIEQPKGRSR